MRTTHFVSVLSIFLIASCTKSEVLYVASDYAYVGTFTQGLEGPAVDKKGNLIL